MSEKKKTARVRKVAGSGARRSKRVAKKASSTTTSRSGPPKALRNDLEIRLKEQRDEIRSLFRQDLDVGQGGTSSHAGEDDVDRANFDFSRELALSMFDGEREVLMLISEALERLKVGAYGSCSNCSRSIAEARLVAIPWARHCVDCQELEEKGLLGA